MNIFTIIAQALAPFMLLIGLGMTVIYSWISIVNSTFEWLMIAIGISLIVLCILFVRFVQHRKNERWFEVLLDAFFWT